MSRTVVIFIIITIIGGCSAIDCTSPEAQLRAEFQSRSAILSEILRMSNGDRTVVRIAPTFTRLETDWSWPRSTDKLGFSQERWDEYRRLVKQAGLPNGIDRDEGAVFFPTKACGLGISGRSYGYAFVKTPPPDLLPSLDAGPGKGVGFVPLQDHWYLFTWGT